MGELNSEVFKIKECEWNTKTPFASIRRIVRHTNGIYRIKPGLYALEKYRKKLESQGILVKRSSTIDTIWFNNRKMPHSFFEIEHSTDIQNSLLKFNDLQDFHTRMIIVADQKRKTEFESKMELHAFDELRENKRVSFFSYENLIKQYEIELEKQALEFII